MAVSTWHDERREPSIQAMAEAMRNGISPGGRRRRMERRVDNVVMKAELSQLPGDGKGHVIFSRKRQRDAKIQGQRNKVKCHEARPQEVQYFQAACETGRPAI